MIPYFIGISRAKQFILVMIPILGVLYCHPCLKKKLDYPHKEEVRKLICDLKKVEKSIQVLAEDIEKYLPATPQEDAKSVNSLKTLAEELAQELSSNLATLTSLEEALKRRLNEDLAISTKLKASLGTLPRQGRAEAKEDLRALKQEIASLVYGLDEIAKTKEAYQMSIDTLAKASLPKAYRTNR